MLRRAGQVGRRRGAGLLGLVIALGYGTGAGADTIYRWVGPDGAVQFSDRPPPAGAAGVERTELAPEPPSPAPAEDPYSVVSQARRMEAQRLEAERQRAEIEALRRQAAPAEPPPVARPAEPERVPIWVVPPYYGVPAYGWPWHGHRPPHPGRPHPPVSPPERPEPPAERPRPRPSFGVEWPRR